MCGEQTVCEAVGAGDQGGGMSRREMEAGPGWGSGGGEEFRFWVDFVGGAHRVEPRQTRYGYERKRKVRKHSEVFGTSHWANTAKEKWLLSLIRYH